MTEKNTKSWKELTGAIVCITFLSACGAGTDVDTTEYETPELGPAVDAPTVPIPETVPVPEQVEVEAEPTPIPAEPEPEPEPIPEQPAEPEPQPEPEPIPEQPAEPLPAPPMNVSCNATAGDIQSSTLSLINTARATARSCGDTFFEAAPPLTWSTKLATAARLHSEDMAQNNFFSHTGSDGLSVSQRVDEQQYNWRRVGENIAAGQPTTESAIDAWIDSPGHCKNLMNPNFTETAVECVEDNGSQYRQYWTNVLGTSFLGGLL